MDMLDDQSECFELDLTYAKRLRETGLTQDAIPFATRAFEFLKNHSDTDQDNIFDAVTCFVLMGDDFKDADETELAKTFLGHADHLAQQVIATNPIGRTWPIAFGRLALLYHDLTENDASIAAATVSLKAFQGGLNAGNEDFTPMDLACVSALLAAIYNGQNLAKQMEQYDNTIISLSLKAEMIEGYFHELLLPFVITSLTRSLEKMDGKDGNFIQRLINELEGVLSQD
jgi:hypothetical protein